MTPPQGPFAAVLTGVSHRFRGETRESLACIDLAIERGTSVALIGASGAGKSTLLTLLDGRLDGWGGAAVVLDQALRPDQPLQRENRADIGFVFQEFALVERASVYRNVLNGRLGRTNVLKSLLNRFSPGDHEAVEAALRDAGIADLAQKRADHLSGGQRQRVALARCLAQEPKVILADEPISNLDPVRAEVVLRVLSAAARERGASLIFSSHQPDLAARFADRIVALREGKVVFDGAPDDLTPDHIARIYEGGAQSEQHLRLVG